MDNLETVSNSDLSKLWDIMGKGIVGFVTAYRNNRNSQNNKSLNAIVEAKIREYHFGFVSIDGEWMTEQPDVSEKKGNGRSFVIYHSGLSFDDFKDALLNSVSNISQDAILMVKENVGFIYDASSGVLLENLESFKTLNLEEWLGRIYETDLMHEGKSGKTGRPRNRSYVFGTPVNGSYYDNSCIGNHLDVYGMNAMYKKRQTLLSKFRDRFSNTLSVNITKDKD